MQSNKSKLEIVMHKILFYILLLIVWQIICKIGVDFLKIWRSYMFPSPISVLTCMYGMILEKTLIIAFLISFKRIFIGYILSLSIGGVIGVFLLQNVYFKESVTSLILGFQSLPNICWIPLAILWFGLNDNSIIFVIIMGSISSTILSIKSSIENINSIYIKVAKNMGASRLKILLYVMVPAALPEIVQGMRQSWSFAWKALITGEMVLATVGLGNLLAISREFADVNQQITIILVILIIGLAIDRFIFYKVEMLINRKRRYKESSY